MWVNTLPACCTKIRSNSYSFGDKLHFLVAYLDDAAHQIDGEIADSKHRALAMDLQLMPQRRAHAGEQFVHPERFCEVVVGAEIERLHLPSLVATAGQHDDRNAVVAPADHAQQVVALDVRQAEIENDQSGFCASNSSAILPLEASRIS